MDSNLGAIQKAINSIAFYDITYSKEDASENSKKNKDEILFIENLIKAFVHLI